MGRYIDDILQPGEKVLYSTNAHWIFYLPAIVVWIVAGGVASCCSRHDRRTRRLILSVPGRAAVVGDCRAVLTLRAWFHRWTTETDVTNLRVVHKTGFISAQTFEMSLDKVESVDVNQSILGRIFNYGDVTIRGVGEGGKTIRPSPRRWRFAITSPRDRTARNPWPCSKSPSDASHPRSIPPRSRNSPSCRTSGGIQTARWRRCTGSIRCGWPIIRDAACRKFDRNVKSLNCLSGLADARYRLRRGPAVRAVHAARRAGGRRRSVRDQHRGREAARRQAHLSIDYRCTTVEEMDVRERFDIVLAMEVVEHVADVGLFLDRCAAMLKPGGMMVVSTLNRNWKSFALGIVAAEYVLRWLPRGTHQWDKFVTPDELAHHLARNKLAITDQSGVVYQSARRQMVAVVRHGRELHGGGGAGVAVTRHACSE